MTRLGAPRLRWRFGLIGLLVLVIGMARAGVYDVLVVGSEPEAIAAAVAAAESGARTLLISSEPRLGGLFVQGALNVLDVRVTPVHFQRGIFWRWWQAVGGGYAFDVLRAEEAFAALLNGAGVQVRLAAPVLSPVLDGNRVVGVAVAGEGVLYASQIVDGTADADLAAAAGARSSFGFAALGHPVRMADTLVFAIEGVDWAALRRGVQARGRDYAYADATVAYGHFAGHPAAYRASDPDLRLRGLNLGRQADGSVLVNALLIYGLDPFDPASLAAGHARAAAEVPSIVAWLASGIPGFERASAGAVAERLYVRQTRHLVARCILTVDDVLDGLVTPYDVAAGGYPLDVQTLTPHDDGFVFGLPSMYGARLCHTVPEGVDGLWVVGRSAGFDPIAHSSARVVPFGMALAEAVGVAAAFGAALDLSPASIADDEALIRDLREALGSRGAYLPTPPRQGRVGPTADRHYGAYRELLRWGLAVGGYGNDPALATPASRTSLLFLLSNVMTRVHGDPVSGRQLVDRFGLVSGPLAADEAAAIVASALCVRDRCPNDATWEALRELGLQLERPDRPLQRGEVYALASLLVDGRRPNLTAP